MNFFENQDRARKHTFRLILYFVLAIILIIIALNTITVGAMIYLKPQAYYVHTHHGYLFNQQAITKLMLHTALLVSPIIIIIILLGTLLKMLSLREGGIAVAKMVKAVEISPQSNDFLEKRFINIVEEMAIASGVRVPKLYVMEDAAINAFVAGIKPDDTVMVVTRGALQQLSRDELQGVVGHEFSHIFNSDMQISIKLMAILGGLLLLGQLGFFLLRIFSRTSTRGRSDKNGGSIVLAIIIIGIGLLVIGYIGLFFGRLIKAAVARERELLADASSVQYTRNPQGIIFALKRIQQSEQGTYLATKNVEDISHMCFCTPRWIMFSDLLATHPPLASRIQMLDPENQYASLPLVDLKKEKDEKPPKSSLKDQGFIMGGAALGAALLTPLAIKNSIGSTSSDNIALAQQLLGQIPQNLKSLAHDPTKVPLLLYALILSHHEDKIEAVSQLLSKELKAEDLNEVVTVSKLILDLPKSIQLPLLDIAIPAYKANSIDTRNRIYQNIQDLSSLTEKKLFQFTLLTLIGKATQDKLPQENKVKYKDFQSVLPEISMLICMLLKAQTKDEAKINSEFENLMKNFTDNKVQLVTSGMTLVKFQEALNTLNQLSPLCKEKLIHVILQCVSQENTINFAEAELVRVIGASLDCPIAPLVPTTDT